MGHGSSDAIHSADRVKLAPEAFELLEVNDHYLGARGSVETDLLSRSDMACLLDAARKYGTMPFGQLKQLSHQGKAFENADANGEMMLSDLIDELKGAGAVASHLKDRAPGEAHTEKEPPHHAKPHGA